MCFIDNSPLVDKLLAHGATPDIFDMLDALEHHFLTPDLAKRMIDAGVDSNQCFYILARDASINPIVNFTKMIGISRLTQAIQHYANHAEVIDVLKQASVFLTKEYLNIFYNVSHYPVFDENSVVKQSGKRKRPR